MKSLPRLSPTSTLAILTGLNLFNYLDRFVISAVLAPLQAELHLSDGEAGRIITGFMIGYFVTSPIFGILGDRWPRKYLIALGIFVWSLGTVLTGFATGLAMMLAFRFFVGVGEASYATISPSLLSDTFPREKRNQALTIFYAAIPVGAALGNILGGWIASEYSWRHAFIWAGAPGLLLALILLPFREPERGRLDADQPGSHTAKPPGWRATLQLLLLPRYRLAVLGYTAYTFALGGFAAWGPTFLHRVHAVPIAQSGTFFGATLVVAGLVGTLAGGFIASYWQKRHPAGYALLLTLSVALAVPFAFTAFLVQDRFLSMAFLSGAMVLLFLPTGPINTVILEAVPVTQRSSAMALSIFAIHLFGDMWSPEIVGHLSDQWSLGRAVLILPSALIIGVVFWALLARHDARNRPGVVPA